jgi:membrane protease YdiL (CAAX protease family)
MQHIDNVTFTGSQHSFLFMNIFFNQNEDRMRAGWRVAVQFFFMYLIGIGLVLIVSPLLPDTRYLLTTAAITVGAVISIVLAAKSLDKRPWQQFGVHFHGKSLLRCALAFLLAGAAMGIIFLIEYALGWLTFTGFGWQRVNASVYLLSLGSYFLLMILVGFYEELVFRGYHIVNISEGLNGPGLSRRQAVVGAVIISSVVFGAAHLINPNADWISTLNIGLAGALLALPFIITGSLSISIGLHVGWNFFQGGVFGFPVSGVPARASLLQIQQKGPELLTGGGFGPEGGLMGIAGYLVIGAALVWYFKKCGQSFDMRPELGVYTPHPIINSYK